MVYQLGNFDKWIRKDIKPETAQHFTENQIKEYLDFAVSEKETICSYFRNQAIGKPPIPTIKFIQAHQIGVTTITNIIIGYTKSGKYQVTPELESFYFQICLILDEIIQLIQYHLPEYFDDDMPITYINAEVSRVELNKQLQTLKPLEQNSAMDKALLRLATRPIRLFIEEKKQISYFELNYMKELIGCLQGLSDLDDNADITYEMHLTLLQLNFNFPRYVLHYSYWLDAQLAAIPDRTQRLDKLSWYIHAIENIRVKPDCILIPTLPSLADQLLTSIKTTYQFLSTEERVANHTVVNQISQGEKPVHAKIQLSISVPLLALFIKVFIAARVIVNENKADVFRIIAQNFTTTKSGNISYDSLRGKYSKPPSVAYLQLREILIKMLELLKKF